MDSHSDDASEFWKALNMCYILLELTENKNAKSCDVPSVNDFLEEVTTFMANNTFVHPLSLPLFGSFLDTFVCLLFHRTQDMSELCEYAKSLTARCQKLMDTHEHQAQPPSQASAEAEGAL